MTASTTHSTALAAIEAALEVDDLLPEYERAWLWNEATDDTLAGWGYHIGQMLDRLPRDRQTEDMQESIESMLADLRDARALVRRSLLNAKETLEQHRPKYFPPCDCHPDVDRTACDWDGNPWADCPEVRRALALVNDIPEGDAK